ncbi:MAG TPA: hypothetical protein PLI27_03925 [Ignavibacteriales bacterium]|nr:hypothetical protein [Ignavibacteriales bacterium]HOL81843.1 hypothetical protein [Ignavibacteriales bacterium]HOM65056.1 hypothetical protein [Ignavibacteriales bacterium]HPD67212.1 hypothetical protein [Ignavibacteriales bacterium]HPP34020.1 hypothetical protein [Ignavibacteriales bacterium]
MEITPIQAVNNTTIANNSRLLNNYSRIENNNLNHNIDNSNTQTKENSSQTISHFKTQENEQQKLPPLSKRDKLPDDEKWKYDLVNLLLKKAIYVPPKSFYSRFELFI